MEPPAAPPLPSVPALGASKTDEPTRAWRASDLREPQTETSVAPVTPKPERRPVGEARRLRKGRLAIRKIDPISVFRFSLVFQFCSALIGLLAVGLIYLALRVIGTLDTFEAFIGDFVNSEFSIHGGKILFFGFIVGCIWTVASSVVMTFGAFLYNLIADVVGGLELIVVERDEN